MTKSWGWRFLAALCLVVLGILFASVVVFTLRNLLLVLAFVITFILFAYGGWLIFTGTSRRYTRGWLLVAVASALLIIETLFFFAGDHNVRLLVSMFLLFGVYAFLLTKLRTMYWQERRRLAQYSGISTKTRHPVLIINPKSGNGRAIKANIPALAKKMGIHVLVLKKGDDVATVAQKAFKNGADVLGISGGDGSLGAVAAVAVKYKLPMVVLPGGTRCHFARDLGMDPVRIVDALAGFQGVERRVDVGDINGRLFLNNASFGLYADIVDRPDYREHKLGATRQVLTSIMSEHRDLYDLQFTGPDNSTYSGAAAILVGVNAYETINILEFGYRQSLDAGQLQITAITALNDHMLRRLLRPIRVARITKIRDIVQWENNKFTVASNLLQLVVGVDGEREEYKTPVTITIKHRALRLLVPAEGLRPRQRRALDSEVIRKVHQFAATSTRNNKHVNE